MGPAREDPDLLWAPRADAGSATAMGRFLAAVGAQRGRPFRTYADAWQWSVDEPDAFWSAVWGYFSVTDGPAPRRALASPAMPGADWFPGAALNWAERVLAMPGRSDADEVLVGVSQSRDRVAISAAELRAAVAHCRAGLVRLGVGRGDRVAAYLPNIPEAVIALLATASLGATWTSCAPEFGVRAVVDRLGQVAPTVLLAVDGYRYGDRPVDRAAEVATIRAALPTLRATVVVPYLRQDQAGALAVVPRSLGWSELLAAGAAGSQEFTRVPFSHPLWVLYSSGTTGLPKPIVHGHGGILLEHLKALSLHTDLGPSDRFCWFTTTGWMMWNYLVSGLAVGSTLVLFDGNPAWPDLGRLWQLAAGERVTYLGVSASFLMACRAAGLEPGRTADLSALRGVGSTGSPLPAAGFHWVHDSVSAAAPVGSLSGGTDVCTGFLGPSPLLPVRAGEIPGRMLGARVESFDAEGRSLVGKQGELVISAPMPSMPIGFWGDADGSRYRAAYFERFPGAWCHGDWLTVHQDGSCVISGRSDATLNRGGVRLGTAEFYTIVEAMPEIADALVIHLEDGHGGPGELILFVALRGGRSLDGALRTRIGDALRSGLSPRHVPDSVIAVPGVPRTLSGKKLEIPVKRILQGLDPELTTAVGSLADPGALAPFVALAARRHRTSRNAQS